MSIRELYDAASVPLPPFEQLDAEFDISELPPETRRVVKDTAKRVFDRLNSFRGILEGLLQPDRILEMQEASALTDADRAEISSLLRKLMRLDRLMLEAELHNTDQAYAEYLRIAWAEWPMIKNHILPIIKKIQDEWKKPSAAKSVLHYLG